MTNTADSGAGSLRQAILDANAAAGADTIAFNIPGSGPFLIQPLTLLPPLAGETTLDGTTQPGYAGTPLIELANFSGAGLRMTGTGANTIRGVCVHDFNAGDPDRVERQPPRGLLHRHRSDGNDRSRQRNRDVVLTAGASGNTDRGLGRGAGNLISGNATGIQSTGGGANVIQGNLIGTDITGNATLPNGEGISLTGTTGFLIGGPNPGEGNVISGNTDKRHPRLGGERVHDPGKQDRHERGGDGVAPESSTASSPRALPRW